MKKIWLDVKVILFVGSDNMCLLHILFSTDDYTMNLYHKSLLCWNFQRDFDLSKIDSWIGT